jgi:hypothetical protein
LSSLASATFERAFAACDLQALDEIAGAHEQHAPSILDECEADAPTVTRAVPRRPPSARRGDPVAARPAHWQAVWELSAQEAAGNVAHGPAVFVNTRGSHVATEKLVALLGAENLIVVTTADVVLVLFAATAARPASPRCA